MTSRRHFLHQLSTLALGATVSPTLLRAWRPGWQADPFTLGVASGDPRSDGVVLWTRLAPDPYNGGGMPNAAVDVRWEVAADEGMQRLVRRGVAKATPEWAHSVHVEVDGLAPDRWYWYRFASGDAVSAVGRTRTMPARGVMPERLRLAFASCQHYEYGFYTAHRHMAQEDVDLIAFLGDYIYESTVPNRPRQHGAPPPRTLEEYRARYALYKLDKDLQAAHLVAPWIVTWDDHEVDNNYASALSSRPGVTQQDFLLQRAAAYRAYYEHQPLRRSSIPRGPDMLLYRTLAFGALARFQVLDTRQYRSDQACGDGRQAPCAEWSDTSHTMLGAVQERWLSRNLEASRDAGWNVLAQQVTMAPIDNDPGPDENYAMDPWSGYPAARDRLSTFIAERRVNDVVVLTGDVHANFCMEVRTAYGSDPGAVVASEFVGTSISSGGNGSEGGWAGERIMAANPWMKYHSNRRGYVRCEVTPTLWRSDYRILPYIDRPGAPVSTHASWVTERGRPGPQRA